MSRIQTIVWPWWPLIAIAVLAIATVIALPVFTAQGADHLDAPLVQADGRIDINDVYAFVDEDDTVLIMTVNPLAGVMSPTTFHPDADYEFLIDNDGDFKKDIRIRVRFDDPDDGEQEVEVDGGRFEGEGETGEAFELDDDGMAMAGVFDDPFFFDFVAFLGTVKGKGAGAFCDPDGEDFFFGANVSAIVIRVPSDWLTDDSDVIRVWGSVKVNGDRIERMGLPAINTVLIPDGSEDAYNETKPEDDVAEWTDEVVASLVFFSGLDGTGYSVAAATAIAGALLPDVLTLDTSSEDGFVPGLNGRRLDDDVIDFELLVVTGGFPPLDVGAVLDSDCVDANDVDFLDDFPYLADPHGDIDGGDDDDDDDDDDD